MGSYQVKCQCGKFSTTKIIINYNYNSINFEELNRISGYIGWSMSFQIRNVQCEACPCDNCVEIIIENLNKNNINARLRFFGLNLEPYGKEKKQYKLIIDKKINELYNKHHIIVPKRNISPIFD